MILNGHFFSNTNNIIDNYLLKYCISPDEKDERYVAESIFPLLWTFDDAHMDQYKIANFLESEYGIKFHFFIAPKLIDYWEEKKFKIINDKLRDTNVELMNWDHIRELIRRGHKVGLHGFDHSDFRQLTEQESIEQHENSISLIKNRLGFIPNTFAFPFGRVKISTYNNILEDEQIILAKKYYQTIYLSDNRMPLFSKCNIVNRRHSEFSRGLFINILKGVFQNYKYTIRTK